ncbi:MAG: histidine phosphatase family protein [Actinomycetota bacterium]
MTQNAASFPQTLYQPEPGAAQILLVRHGQSAPFVPDEPFELLGGHGDPHLTDLGHHQAELVGARLASEPIDAIYVSSLTRTHQTAAPLARRLGLDLLVEPDLREVYLGDAEGGFLRQMMADEHPAVLAMRANEEWGEIPGAETTDQFMSRTVGAVERIAEANADRFVVAFCHGGVIGAVLAHVTGSRPFAFNGARHTSISHLVVNPTGWVMRSFNDGSHAGTLTRDHAHPTSS